MTGGRVTPTDVIRALQRKLGDMQLLDATGDPRDEGYMDAWLEIQNWLHEEPWMRTDGSEGQRA